MEDRSRSPKLDLLAFISSWLVTAVCSGILFGFHGFQSFIYGPGHLFENLCEPTEKLPCEAQQLRVDLVYSISMAAFFCSFASFGPLVDRWGSRVPLIISVTIMTISSIVVGFANTNVVWVLGFLGWGLSAPGILLSTLSQARMFPGHQHLTTTLIFLAFDLSAIVPWAFSQMVAILQWNYICWGYASILFCLGFISAVFAPSQEDIEIKQREHKQNISQELINSTYLMSERGLHPTTIWEFCKTPGFVVLILFMTILNLKNIFYITTFSSQITIIVPHSPTTINFLFDILLPLSGVLALPFSYFLIGRKQTDHVIFGFILILAEIHGFLNLFEIIEVQMASMIFFFFLKNLYMFSLIDWITRRAPADQFGSILGIGSLVMGMCTMISYGMIHATQAYFKDQFLIPNGILTGLEVLCIGVPIFFFREANGKKRPPFYERIG